MEKDLKEWIEEVVKKIKDDPSLMETFKDNPVKAVETLTGKDLPDQMADSLIAGVKAKLGADDLGDALGQLTHLFGK